jgi:hypothetical protein
VDKEDTIELSAPVVPAPPEPRSVARGQTHVGWSLPDIAGAAILALCVFVVHDVGYMLTTPFSLDESWVALSTRAPVGSLPWMTSSTPLGWTLLLRLVPTSGEALRVVPLVFTVGAVVAAWWFGRELPLPWFTALLTGLAVLLVPALLVRDDLKQYTAEACAAMVLLVLVARLEAQWSRRRLAAIVIFTPAAMLFANAVVFVGVAAVAAIAIEPLARRDWRRLRDVTIAGLTTVGLSAVVYAAVDARNANPTLTSFWDTNYLPRNHGVHGAVTFVHNEASALAPYLGLRFLALEVLMLVVGIVVLIRVRRYAVAAMVPLTILLVLAASAFRKFPFGDVRTSTFWLVMVAAVMAVGAAGIVDVLRRRTSALVAGVALVATVAIWIAATHSDVRSHAISTPLSQGPALAWVRPQYVRSQVRFLEANRRPNDVVIVDWGALWVFSYYQHLVKPSIQENVDWSTTGYLPSYPETPWIVQLYGRNAADVYAALSEAKAQAHSRNGRIWIIRSLLSRPGSEGEALAWKRSLSGKDVKTIAVGPEPLLLYEPAH